MIFETLVLGLTLLKGVKHFRGTNSTLVSVLYRDGILNYIYLCILSIINVTVLLTAPHGYSTFLTALQRTLHSILSARILLHLREVALLRTMAAEDTATAPYSYHGPSGYFTTEMGVFTADINRTMRSGESVAWEFNHGRKSPGVDTMMTSYGQSNLDSIYDESPVNSESGLIVSEVGSEDLFGDREEGQWPETVTWFGDMQDLDVGRNGDVKL
ncbi:hypothetical protein M422DRAFT_276896 [Sphaerobolus stellatus SS14]|uniref:Uncharacterized protein n=1 Tax=Sphaerobolus stellatus (strain SS14) TaxID=990650 RepID=A0A0C9UAU8_SPHS4|nr:hypothetical protein M422DRAFT_276896 [Sphaerobolus stellatus SS14]